MIYWVEQWNPLKSVNRIKSSFCAVYKLKGIIALCATSLCTVYWNDDSAGQRKLSEDKTSDFIRWSK